MASRKRLPKPKGESDCSRRTATVPVTCFIDVKRNATTKRVTRELVAVVFGCGALMLAPPCKPDGQPRPHSQSERGTRADAAIGPPPSQSARGRERAQRCERGMPVQDPNDRSLYPTSRLRFVVWRRPQC